MDVEWVEGSFPLVSVRCIKAIGYLDPYLHLGSEDADFCRRALYHGWRVVLAPAAGVHHYGGAWTNASVKNTSFHTRCRAKNYYIYKLTNPNQHFVRNLLEAVYLFAVKIKASLLAPRKDLGTEVAIFLEVLFDWKTIYSKWRRDLAHRQPPQLCENTSLVHVEITQRKSQVLQSSVTAALTQFRR
jgi:GT2 family glycosyltransferase